MKRQAAARAALKTTEEEEATVRRADAHGVGVDFAVAAPSCELDVKVT